MGVRDMAASVRQRLLNRSRDTGESFQLLLTRYGIERLLYRLSRSEYADQFLLKGALLFDLWYDEPLRPTRDADLLRIGPAEVDSVREFPAPNLRAYPVYSVIAEKFHAVVVLGEANTRIKDYFDLHVLIEREQVEASVLVQAIRATFARRDTSLPEEMPPGLTKAFAENEEKDLQWRNFLSRNQLDEQGMGLSDLVTELRDFFAPVLQWINSSDPGVLPESRWRSGSGWSPAKPAAGS